MLGIGNAYFYQGQYAQAKKYYEDILKVDKNSVIGYSGLLNLYVERDSFPMVATLHAEIREKNMLPDLPSPLLSKLAGYYLDKSAR
jgi:tetratricopeptide (TPR) repeat protein